MSSSPKDTPRPPDSIVVDLKPYIETYEKKVRPLKRRLDTDPGEMVHYITQRICKKDSSDSELYDAVEEIQTNIDDQGEPEIAACFADAAMTLGTEVLKQIDNVGMYAPDGSFDYYFAGWTNDTGRTAVFKHIPAEDERDIPIMLFMSRSRLLAGPDDDDEDDVTDVA